MVKLQQLHDSIENLELFLNFGAWSTIQSNEDSRTLWAQT